MTRKLTLITGLACLASALVNNDESGLDAEGLIDLKAFREGIAFDLGPSARVEDVARDAEGEGIEARNARIALASVGGVVLAEVVDYVVAYDPAEAREAPEEYTGPDETDEEEPLPGSLQGLTVDEAKAALAPVAEALDRKLAEEAAEAALNAGCLLIQQRLGVESGDLAALWWSGTEEDALAARFLAYIKSERAHASD